MRTDVTGILNRLEGALENALLVLSKGIGTIPQESQESEQLHAILTRLSAICHDVEDLRKGGNPIPPDPDVLHLKDKVGRNGQDQTKQMLALIQAFGAARIYGICKQHNIVATQKTTHLFVDKEPYTLAEPAKAIPGENGETYYVYCCLSMEQKQKRLDEIAKWL